MEQKAANENAATFSMQNRKQFSHSKRFKRLAGDCGFPKPFCAVKCKGAFSVGFQSIYG
jgi:hypothetical protein